MGTVPIEDSESIRGGRYIGHPHCPECITTKQFLQLFELVSLVSRIAALCADAGRRRAKAPTLPRTPTIAIHSQSCTTVPRHTESLRVSRLRLVQWHWHALRCVSVPFESENCPSVLCCVLPPLSLNSPCIPTSPTATHHAALQYPLVPRKVPDPVV